MERETLDEKEILKVTGLPPAPADDARKLRAVKGARAEALSLSKSL
jgi:hypothetical protein